MHIFKLSEKYIASHLCMRIILCQFAIIYSFNSHLKISLTIIHINFFIIFLLLTSCSPSLCHNHHASYAFSFLLTILFPVSSLFARAIKSSQSSFQNEFSLSICSVPSISYLFILFIISYSIYTYRCKFKDRMLSVNNKN